MVHSKQCLDHIKESREEGFHEGYHHAFRDVTAELCWLADHGIGINDIKYLIKVYSDLVLSEWNQEQKDESIPPPDFSYENIMNAIASENERRIRAGQRPYPMPLKFAPVRI